jgi:hypothetical protein
MRACRTGASESRASVHRALSTTAFLVAPCVASCCSSRSPAHLMLTKEGCRRSRIESQHGSNPKMRKPSRLGEPVNCQLVHRKDLGQVRSSKRASKRFNLFGDSTGGAIVEHTVSKEFARVSCDVRFPLATGFVVTPCVVNLCAQQPVT